MLPYMCMPGRFTFWSGACSGVTPGSGGVSSLVAFTTRAAILLALAGFPEPRAADFFAGFSAAMDVGSEVLAFFTMFSCTWRNIKSNS